MDNIVVLLLFAMNTLGIIGGMLIGYKAGAKQPLFEKLPEIEEQKEELDEFPLPREYTNTVEFTG